MLSVAGTLEANTRSILRAYERVIQCDGYGTKVLQANFSGILHVDATPFSLGRTHTIRRRRPMIEFPAEKRRAGVGAEKQFPTQHQDQLKDTAR